MDPESFTSDAPGRLIRSGEGREAYWAFVPDPLPPRLSLHDPELWRVHSAADRAIGELAGLGRAIPNPHILVSPFLRREAVLSSQIEGTQTGIAELYAFEAGQLSLPGLETEAQREDAQEVANYVTALQHGVARLSELPVSLRLIRDLHSIPLTGVRGEAKGPGRVRQVPAYIGTPSTTIAAADFVFTPPYELEPALDALEKYIHADSEFPPLMRLALIHYQFETVHPFADGNGRIGRLLVSLLAVAWGLLPAPLLYLSAYFQRHRTEYVTHLREVSTQGAWRDWVLFFLQGVLEQAVDAVDRAKRLQDLQLSWRTQLAHETRSVALLAVVDSLLDTPVVTSSEIMSRHQIGDSAARGIIRQLVDLGILERAADTGRQRLYWCRPILSILK